MTAETLTIIDLEGYCHVNYPERKELVNAFPSGTRRLLVHVKCFGSE